MYQPHYRLTMGGRLGGPTGPEIASLNISLSEVVEAGPGIISALFDIDQSLFDDLANDCVDWWARPTSAIHPDAVLTSVKLAWIGDDGHYTRAPMEKAVEQVGAGNGAARPANQVCYAVSLNTEGDLRRVKGRFYAPLPAVGLDADGRITDNDRNSLQSSAQTFLDALNNQPQLDTLNIKTVVASQGRHNDDGSVRLGPRNHVVTSVSVGRVPDTQRRRRNALGEGKTSLPVS